MYIYTNHHYRFSMPCLSLNETASKAQTVLVLQDLFNNRSLIKGTLTTVNDSVFFSISRSVVYIFMANINQPHLPGPRTLLRNKALLRAY